MSVSHWQSSETQCLYHSSQVFVESDPIHLLISIFHSVLIHCYILIGIFFCSSHSANLATPEPFLFYLTEHFSTKSQVAVSHYSQVWSQRTWVPEYLGKGSHLDLVSCFLSLLNFLQRGNNFLALFTCLILFSCKYLHTNVLITYLFHSCINSLEKIAFMHSGYLVEICLINYYQNDVMLIHNSFEFG
jgi:hypothetical protein